MAKKLPRLTRLGIEGAADDLVRVIRAAAQTSPGADLEEVGKDCVRKILRVTNTKALLPVDGCPLCGSRNG